MSYFSPWGSFELGLLELKEAVFLEGNATANVGSIKVRIVVNNEEDRQKALSAIDMEVVKISLRNDEGHEGSRRVVTNSLIELRKHVRAYELDLNPNGQRFDDDPMKCACLMWARTKIVMHLNAHHPNCPRYDVEDVLLQARAVIQGLVGSMEAWRDATGGMHQAACDAYENAKLVLTGPVLKFIRQGEGEITDDKGEEQVQDELRKGSLCKGNRG